MSHKTKLFKLLFLLFLSLEVSNIILSEEPKTKELDSLVKFDFEELKKNISRTLQTNRSLSEIYTRAYLEKGKRNKDLNKTGMGYVWLSSFYSEDLLKQIKYIDSAINITKNTKDYEFLVQLYLSKGIYYERKRLSNKALDSYLEALTIARENRSKKYISSSQHNIALLKRKLGKYQEAKSSFKESMDLISLTAGSSEYDTISYLISISELVTTYRQQKEFDSAIFYNRKGLNMANGKKVACLFIFNKGILEYQKLEYKKAIENISQSTKLFLRPDYQEYLEYYNLIEAYLFLGKSYKAISQKEKALTFFKKIDSIASKNEYTILEVREAYTEIIEYYKSIKDKDKQLYYINRLLYNDSIYNGNYKSVSSKLVEEYDTPRLLSEKEELITELENKNNKSSYGLIILLAISISAIICFIIYYHRNKNYKTRFEQLIKEKEEIPEKENTVLIEEDIGISDKVVATILKELEDFEVNRGFLKQNLTSSMLATMINTNSKYLTKVIKFYRHKTFTSYINDLRVAYIINQIKKDHKLQNYTIKALATEAGFNSPEVFSKSFLKKTGIYPSYFIKRMQNPENK